MSLYPFVWKFEDLKKNGIVSSLTTFFSAVLRTLSVTNSTTYKSNSVLEIQANIFLYEIRVGVGWGSVYLF